ncbi:transmembrane protease serine 4-like isoform X2 [Dermacentor variabilis]|uniref:transmembrane protease serine 4-like isoform X2 n=1 Tax=Dermacentor variabilis TaxID=34621 RepID=UPI003F5BCEBE
MRNEASKFAYQVPLRKQSGRRHGAFRVLWFVSVCAASSANTTTGSGVLWTKQPCGQTQFVPRIINGLRAPEHRYPWVVLVQARNEVEKLTGLCGGTIITSKHVLTAGHCLFLYEDKTLKNDIAVLELSHKLKFSDHVQPVCLPTEDFPPLPGTVGIVAGWGYTSESGQHHRNPYLLYVTQVIKGEEYCKAKMEGYYYSPSTAFCAYRYSYDACQGDSGGGLMVLHDERWYTVGIISYGVGCATPGMPGVYTDVTRYIGWLRHALRGYL